jgi:manganese/iron transport system permease protein
MLDIILDPLGYQFMVRGLMASVVVGVVCSTLGVFIVLRGMALFGNALAHAVLPGVAMGYLIAGNDPVWLSVGGLLAGILTALGVGTISKEGIKEDTAIGVMFAGMFALGIAMISTVRSYTVDLTHFLFGDVLGVSNNELWIISIGGGLVLLAIFAFYKEFQLISFDPLLAQTLRLPVTFLNHLMLLLITITIILALQTVGIALMSAMLVTPAATANLLTRRLSTMMMLAAIIGAISAVTGLYLSFYINISSGPAIVLVCTSIFGVAFIYSKNN